MTWWKRLGISAIKTGQDAPSWIWCTERLSFFGGGHIVLQRFVHVRCHFQPLPTKLVFAYFDRGSYEIFYAALPQILGLSASISSNIWLSFWVRKTPSNDANGLRKEKCVHDLGQDSTNKLDMLTLICIQVRYGFTHKCHNFLVWCDTDKPKWLKSLQWNGPGNEVPVRQKRLQS